MCSINKRQARVLRLEHERGGYLIGKEIRELPASSLARSVKRIFARKAFVPEKLTLLESVLYKTFSLTPCALRSAMDIKSWRHPQIQCRSC